MGAHNATCACMQFYLFKLMMMSPFPTGKGLERASDQILPLPSWSGDANVACSILPPCHLPDRPY